MASRGMDRNHFEGNSDRGGQRARHQAMYPYNGDSDRELSFEKGNVFEIINRDTSGWCYAKNLNTGETGLVPGNFLQIQTRQNSLNDANQLIEGSNAFSVGSNQNRTTRLSVDNTRAMLVGLCDFQGRSKEEISFRKGDKLKLLKKGETWHKARNLTNDEVGYIPINFVCLEQDQDFQSWFFGDCKRVECEAMLLNRTNTRGAFMVRKTEKLADTYSLSIRNWTEEKKDHVIHYLIKTESGRLFLTKSHMFNTLEELVAYYKENLVHICHKLTEPCPMEEPFLYDLSKEDNWEIPRYKLNKEKEIGNGASGVVWKGKWCGFTDVAIKELTNSQDISLKGEFLKEAAIMKKLRHRKLLALYGVCTKEEPFALVLEYMPNGNLKDYLAKCSRFKLKEQNLVSIAAQIADAMTYLENHHIVHMDLAARNVLVGESNEVKVSDFGLARYSHNDEKMKKVPVKWLAPELFEEGAKPTHKSDVWSFAVLLYELFTYGETPYPGVALFDMRKFISRPANKRMEKPLNFPIRVYNFMLCCWHPEPEQRPSFFNISKFFDNYTNSVGDTNPLTP